MVEAPDFLNREANYYMLDNNQEQQVNPGYEYQIHSNGVGTSVSLSKEEPNESTDYSSVKNVEESKRSSHNSPEHSDRESVQESL